MFRKTLVALAATAALLVACSRPMTEAEVTTYQQELGAQFAVSADGIYSETTFKHAATGCLYFNRTLTPVYNEDGTQICQ